MVITMNEWYKKQTIIISKPENNDLIIEPDMLTEFVQQGWRIKADIVSNITPVNPLFTPIVKGHRK